MPLRSRVLSIVGLAWIVFGLAPVGVAAGPRPYTVADSISLVRLMTPYLATHLSPDRRSSLALLRHGDLQSGFNEWQLVRFDALEILDFLKSSRVALPSQDILVRFGSAAPTENSIWDLQWLANGKQLIFIGRMKETQEIGQVYRFDLENRTLRQLTHHSQDIQGFAVDERAGLLLFAASSPPDWSVRNRRGYVVEGHSPDHLITENPQNTIRVPISYFLKNMHTEAVTPIDLDTEDYSVTHMILAPSGDWALIVGGVREVPAHWREYEEIKQNFPSSRGVAPLAFSAVTGKLARSLEEDEIFGRAAADEISRIYLADLAGGRTRPLLDAPLSQSSSLSQEVTWSADGQRLILAHTYLPLLGAGKNERVRRRKEKGTIEIELPTGRIVGIRYDSPGPLLAQLPSSLLPQPMLQVIESLDHPADIQASDNLSHKRNISDFNPRLRALKLGRVEALRWKDRHSIELSDGLLFPPSFHPGKRYPLVIHTYGFNSQVFLESGPATTGFAARVLANRDMLVALTSCGEASMEVLKRHGENELARMCFEDLIDTLDNRGLVDRERIGIIGFSRTGMLVQYAATFSRYALGAALISDSTQATPLNYILAYGAPYPGITVWDDPEVSPFPTMIGVPLWGEGIEMWLKRSPAFNLDRIRTPLRYENHGTSVPTMASWDTFALLKRMHRPVELVHIPRKEHNLVTPLARYTSQQGSVDWFDFWLKGSEDPDPCKAAQYRRWQVLRLQHLAHYDEEFRGTSR